jgi:hypothetical protein
VSPAALHAIADAADALARLARAALEDEPADASKLIRIADAATLAATSARVIREAIRSGALAAYGRQRDRAVRHADLMEWVESRRAKPVAGPDDAEVDRGIRRLARRLAREQRKNPKAKLPVASGAGRSR